MHDTLCSSFKQCPKAPFLYCELQTCTLRLWSLFGALQIRNRVAESLHLRWHKWHAKICLFQVYEQRNAKSDFTDLFSKYGYKKWIISRLAQYWVCWQLGCRSRLFAYLFYLEKWPFPLINCVCMPTNYRISGFRCDLFKGRNDYWSRKFVLVYYIYVCTVIQ